MAVLRLGLFKTSPADTMHTLTGCATTLRHGLGRAAAMRGGGQA